MSEELVQSVKDMLKEETWTRQTISNYTINNIKELAVIIEKANNENCTDEIKDICDEHLTHSKDSIIALYISGMIGLKRGSLDNSPLISLVDFFINNHKEPIVEYLCESILADDETNKFALRTLAECYKLNGKEEVWSIYEKIVKIDLEEADLAKALAEHYEGLGNSETSTDYYKKALFRYVSLKNMNSVKECWTKLVSLIPEEIDFFLLVQRKIAKAISEDKSALLMQELYAYYKDNEKWDTAIDILKLNLSIDPKDPWARREITECFKKKYADHSKVNDYIESSDLTQSFRNVFEAINDFEKHIAFDANNFVYHKTWGVGVIRKVENDNLSINFGKKFGIKELSLKMAVSALQPLAKDHIWVIKARQSIPGDPDFKALRIPKDASKEDKEKVQKIKKALLAKKIKDDKAWALKTIIKSFGNSCDLKKVKAELVPSILTTAEWTSWNTGAKAELEKNPIFGINPNNSTEWVVRDRAITPQEKLSNEFKAQKQFFARLDILMKFAKDEPEIARESELFADMFSYFTGFLKSFTAVNEQVVASYLVVQEIGQLFPNLAVKLSFTFDEMYREIESPRAMYTSLKDTKNTTLKANFLSNIKMLPDWVDQYIKLFPTVLSKDMLIILINAGHVEKVQQLAVKAFDDFRGYRDAILFFFDECSNDEWFKAAEIPLQKQLIALVNIISHSFKEIENHVESTENKKIIKNASKMLFEKNGNIYAQYMISSDMDTMSHMYTLIDDITELDEVYKQKLRKEIQNKYPDYKFHKTEEKAATPKGMFVTAKKLEEKKNLLDEMQTVKIPAIAKEIAEAKEKGDLKENAEYISAKEAQHKLNNDIKRLQGELSRAVLFDPTTATASIISFGTIVTLANKDTGADEVYTILGPWESDPESGIISYMSPFGERIQNHKVGDSLEFSINEHRYNYDVKSIQLARF